MNTVTFVDADVSIDARIRGSIQRERQNYYSTIVVNTVIRLPTLVKMIDETNWMLLLDVFWRGVFSNLFIFFFFFDFRIAVEF